MDLQDCYCTTLTNIRGVVAPSAFVSRVPRYLMPTSIYVSGRVKGEPKMLKSTGPLVRGSGRELKMMGKMWSQTLKRETSRIAGT